MASGIAETDLTKLFTSFNQVDNSSTRNFEGVGVSLTVTARFIDLLGEQLTVQSEMGKGSRFIFELPTQAKN